MVIVVMVMSLLSGCSDKKEAKAPEIVKDERPLIIGIVGPETGEEAAYGISVVEGALAAARRSLIFSFVLLFPVRAARAESSCS